MKLAIHGLLFAALGLCLPGCFPATVGTTRPGVANLDVVDHGAGAVYRGGQPTRDGITTLNRDLHVRTVIDLRDDAVSWEAAACLSQGMTYQRIPSDASVVEPAKIRQFLTLLRAATKPVYVHCMQGRDRTGLELAVYRIVDQGWTRQAAIDELYAHGFNHFWFKNIENYLRTFDPAEFKAPPVTASASAN